MEIESCPFCGVGGRSSLKVEINYGCGEPHPYPDKTYVCCTNCKCAGPMVETTHISRDRGVDDAAKQLAIFKWNTRF